MELWIWLSVAAAAAQTVRFALQKALVGGALSPMAATWSRFLYSAPLVAVLIWVYMSQRGIAFPDLSARFWLFALGGGAAQVLATVSTVALFKRRAFAVGITFKKTEVMITALVGFIILGDAISATGAAALALGFVGVLFLSDPPEGGSIFNRGAALGLLSGLFFALSAVGYRGATLEIAGSDTLFISGITLALVTASQTVGVGLYLMARERAQIALTLQSWRTSVLVGLFSLIGSWCWFAAFSLKSAAYVFAVGQVELIFSVLVGAIWFRERVGGREGIGMILLVASILALVLVGQSH